MYGKVGRYRGDIGEIQGADLRPLEQKAREVRVRVRVGVRLRLRLWLRIRGVSSCVYSSRKLERFSVSWFIVVLR